MAGKVGVGVWAGVGSILGLFAGSMLGASLSRRRPGAASVVLPALAGTALGAGIAAALSAAEPNTVTTTTTTTGAGALPAGLGAAPLSANDASVERYDPARYAGRQPPHKCTVASSTKIAQQIPGAPWLYERSLPPGSSPPWPSVEQMHNVTTPTAKKRIPVQMGNGRLALTCPYTGSVFLFYRGAA